MNKNKSKEIVTILREIIPNPKCELDYKDSFTLLCAVMLSAQTTDKRVNLVTPVLFDKYPTIEALANAGYDDVYQIISSLGLAKTKASNIIHLAKKIHEEYSDVVPNTIDELIKLPGVGRKTASVILVEYYKIPAMPVDTHLHRMAQRLGYIKKTGSISDAEEAYKKYIPKDDWIIAHHLFLLFGRYHCKAINPECTNCKLKTYCKH